MSFNPITQFNAPQYTNTNTTLTTLSPSIKYSLPNGFSAELTYNYTKTLKSTEIYQSDSVWNLKNNINNYTQIGTNNVLTYPINRGGTLNERVDEQIDNNVRALLNYNHNLGADHRIDAVIGYDRNETHINSNYNGWYGYNTQLGTLQTLVDNVTRYTNTNYAILDVPLTMTSAVSTIQNGIYRQFTAFVSSFGNAAYTYKNRYTLSGSARGDEANIFGVSTNNKKKILWSVGGSWRIDQEAFYHISWLPTLKLRTTYGMQGNIPSFSVQSLATISYYASTTNSSGLPYAQLNNLPNPNLRWEQTGQLNIGLDFGVKNNIVSGSIDYYTKKGNDLIGTFVMDPSTGISSYTGNVAGMKGNGVDVTLNTKNIETKDFKWNTRILFSQNADEVTAYYPTTKYYQPYVNSVPYTVGRPINSIYSYKWAGLDPLSGNPQGYVNGNISTDYSTILSSTTKSDIVYNGPANPTIFGSIMNTFSYKGFNISANITYEGGFYYRMSSINYSNLFGSNMITSRGDIDFTKRWQQAGDEKFTNVPSMPTVANSSSNRDYFYQYSSALVAKGDNIRLQDISLSYDLNTSKIKGSPFSSFQLYGYYLVNTYLWRAVDYKLQTPSQTISFGIRATLK